MSQESKNIIIDATTSDNQYIFTTALSIVEKYASTANANPESMPRLLENMIHLLATGEQHPSRRQH